MQPLIVGIGELLWDLMDSGKVMGGAPANFAYHAAAQGGNGIVVSAVGNDDCGREIVRELTNKGLAADYVFMNEDYPTGTVSVTLHDGSPSYCIHAPSAWDHIRWQPELEKLARQASCVCFGSLAQRNAVSADAIQRFVAAANPDCLKIFDINLRQSFFSRRIIEMSLLAADILKISSEELPVIREMFLLSTDEESAAVQLIKLFDLQAVLLTCGADGSRFYSKTGAFAVPAVRCGSEIDTVGCGDAFTAAFAAAFLTGRTPRNAMEHASRLAGLVCASRGATPPIPQSYRLTL
ncbi:MAG: carbohydrate kinase family protein [Victivallaceae bacterium]